MPTLLEDTRQMLDNAPRHLTLTKLAKEAGLQLSWLSDFARGTISDPGVNKVQALYDYLRDMPVHAPDKLMFSAIKNTTILPHLIAVYEICNKAGVIYVGSSGSVMRRLKEHTKWGDLAALKPTYVIITYVDNDTQKLRLERAKIKAYRPVLNKKGL